MLACLELVKHRKAQVGTIPTHLIYVSDMLENSQLGSIETMLGNTAASPSSIKAQGKAYAKKLADYYDISTSDVAHIQSITIVLPTRAMEAEAAYRNVGFFYDSFFAYFNLVPAYTH